MSKKKGMFSWLGLGKKQDKDVTPVVEDVNENTIEVAEETLAASESNVVDTPVDETPIAEENEQQVEETVATEDVIVEALPAEPEPEPEPEVKRGFFARLKQSLTKTRQNLGGGIFSLFRGKKIDDELFEELETHLLLADVGVETTTKIIDSLTESASRNQLKDAEALYGLLKAELKKIIEPVSQPLVIKSDNGPYVILMVGVNGVGKTTTIGKVAQKLQAQGKKVILGAGDTFRAAAFEQLNIWADRTDTPIVSAGMGADPASVLFDTVKKAKELGSEVVLCDTAGRLHTKIHLMDQLKKVYKVLGKASNGAPHEVLLVLDATTGQNAIMQAKEFAKASPLTGLILTKLDGTAKGGIAIGIVDELNIPIKYIGVGESVDDLREFNPQTFVQALFDEQNEPVTLAA